MVNSISQPPGIAKGDKLETNHDQLNHEDAACAEKCFFRPWLAPFGEATLPLLVRLPCPFW